MKEKDPSGREPHLQVEVPKHVRDAVPARFGVEIVKPRTGWEEDELFRGKVSLLITDQFSNKIICSAFHEIGDFTNFLVKQLVRGFEEFLAKQKAA